MADNRIKSVIDPVLNKDVKTTIKDLAALKAQFLDTLEGAIKLREATGKSGGYKDLNANVEKANLAIAKINETIAKTAILEEKLEQLRQKAALSEDQRQQKAQQQAEKEAQRQQKKADAQQKAIERADLQAQRASERELARLERVAAAQQRAAAAAERASQPYNVLKQRLADAEQAAANLGAQFGAQSPQFLEAARGVQVLRREVDSIEQPLGRFQRNVGNYASSLFGFIRQAAYILPGIGIAGIFNLIGEGIGALITKLEGAGKLSETINNLNKKANDLYAEQITKVSLLTGELKDVNTQSLRRQQIIEELNAISPTYFGNLKSEEDIITKLPEDYKRYIIALEATSRAQAAQSLIAEEYKKQLEAQRDAAESAFYYDPKNFNKVNEQYTFLQRAKEAFTHPFGATDNATDIARTKASIDFLTQEYTKSQKKIAEAGGDIAGEQIKIEERLINNFAEVTKIKLQVFADYQTAIAENEKKSYRVRQSALKQAEQANLQIADISNKQELNDITLTNDKKNVIIAKGEAEQEKIKLAYTKSARALREASDRDDLAVLKQRIENEKSADKLIYDNKFQTYQNRIIATQKFQSDSTRLINIAEKAAIRDAGDNEAKKTLIRLQYAKEREDLAKEANDILDGIEREHDEKIIKSLRKSGAQQLQALTENYNNEQQALQNSYIRGEITTNEFERRKANLQQKYNFQSTEQQISSLQKVIDYEHAHIVDASDDERKLAELKAKLSNDVTNLQIENLKKLEEARKDEKAAAEVLEKDLTNFVIQGALSIADAKYKGLLQDLDNQKTAFDVQTKSQVDAENRSLDSSQTKQDKIALINAQALQRQKQFADEQIRIQEEQQKAEKIIKAASILIAGAESVFKIEAAIAVSEALATQYLADPFTAPLYPVIAATIAAQQIQAILVGGSAIANAAAVLAFEKGGTVPNKNPFLIGEKGPELMIGPDGKMQLSPGKPTLMTAKPGTVIKDFESTMRILASPEIPQYVGGQALSTKQMEDLLTEIKRNTGRPYPVQKPNRPEAFSWRKNDYINKSIN